MIMAGIKQMGIMFMDIKIGHHGKGVAGSIMIKGNVKELKMFNNTSYIQTSLDLKVMNIPRHFQSDLETRF